MSLHAQRAPWRAGFGSADARGFFFQAEDGIRDGTVTEVQTCALPIFDLEERRRRDAVAAAKQLFFEPGLAALVRQVRILLRGVDQPVARLHADTHRKLVAARTA